MVKMPKIKTTFVKWSAWGEDQEIRSPMFQTTGRHLKNSRAQGYKINKINGANLIPPESTPAQQSNTIYEAKADMPRYWTDNPWGCCDCGPLSKHPIVELSELSAFPLVPLLILMWP